MGYVSITDVISGLVETKERVGKYDNINNVKKYDRMIISKYPVKESTSNKYEHNKSRTYKKVPVPTSTDGTTYYDILMNGK